MALLNNDLNELIKIDIVKRTQKSYQANMQQLHDMQPPIAE